MVRLRALLPSLLHAVLAILAVVTAVPVLHPKAITICTSHYFHWHIRSCLAATHLPRRAAKRCMQVSVLTSHRVLPHVGQEAARVINAPPRPFPAARAALQVWELDKS